MGKNTSNHALGKIPEITLLFWIMKITATTLGESGGDLLSMTLHIGYAVSAIILISIFFAALATQLFAKKYNPLLYWTVIVSTSTAGTTISDYIDRTLHLGYVQGSLILISILLAILIVWYLSERTLSVTNIRTRKAEVFYWIAILFSNTLGTALGDFLATSSRLGFAGGAAVVTFLLVLVILAKYMTKIPSVILFWVAFVLTRPFGATFGDLLTKTPDKGGLNFGTVGTSLVLLTILAFLIAYNGRKMALDH
jgi:uncharacterized membrane-anchored protein